MPRASARVAAAQYPLRLYVLGAFRIERNSQPIHLSRRKVELLIAYLALHPESHPREKLAALLWGDFPDAQAHKSLRTALPILRRELGNDLLLIERDGVQLNPAFHLWIDVREFEKQATAFLNAVSSNPTDVNLDLYRGELLVDFYDDWILPERERYRTLYLETLLRLIQHNRAQSKYERAIELSRQVLASDPANERAHQHLMLCYIALGNRQAALGQYDQCVSALREELAVEPSPETTALANWIRQTSSEIPGVAARVTNLPIPLSSFIGRKKELSELKEIVSTARLLTLTGAGGSGKTRLAIQTATDLIDAFKDGVWWADLTPLSDSALVPLGIAQALGVRELPNEPLSETLTKFLRSKQLLFVLDNCEHLITACAQLVASLLTICPNLKILTTSREALNLTGEVVFQVHTLSVPDPKQLPVSQLLLQFEGVRLFVERARAVKADFALTDQNARAVAQICQRLDGIPLAIELAAVRANGLSVQEIAQRLDDRFSLLTHGSRAAAPHHQTLRAAFDWSYDLLSKTEQLLFERLAVFVGGFTLEAAEAICGFDGLESSATFEVLLRLVDKSLVTTTQGNPTRYGMLEMIREYAFERLEATGALDTLRLRHRDYYFRFAEQAETHTNGPDETLWVDRLELDYANLRAAMTWSLRRGDADETLVGLLHLWPLWFRRSYYQEPTEWFAQALAAARTDSLIYAEGTLGAVELARIRGNIDQARSLLAGALAMAQATKEDRLIERAWRELGIVAAQEGNFPQAIECLEQAKRLLNHEFDFVGYSKIHYFLAEAWMQSGDFEKAETLMKEALARARQKGDLYYIGWGLGSLSTLAELEGQFQDAIRLSRESLAVKIEGQDRPGVAYTFETLANIATEQNQFQRAAKLWGAAERLRQVLQAAVPPSFRAQYEIHIARARNQLAPDFFAAAWNEGRAMTLEQAIEYAKTDEDDKSQSE